MGIPVKLQVFEGPLDLLLHLIEKNKIDIYDIPIVLITEQYLEYVNQMDHEDLDELDATLMGCRRLIEVQEDKQILFELERVINIATYLKEIEVFTVYNLF